MNMLEEKAWEAAYYRETSRPKRKELLDNAIEEEGMTPANELRVKLYEARYGDSEERGQEVDYFIRGWMSLEYVKTTSRHWKNKKKASRQIHDITTDWQFDLVEEYGEVGRQIIYKEFCNLTRLYISLCEHDHTYGSVVFGIGRMGENSVINKIANDVFKVAYLAPDVLGIKEELSSFTKAASYIFCQMYPEETDTFYRRVMEFDRN